jgi:hypothetical protein
MKYSIISQLFSNVGKEAGTIKLSRDPIKHCSSDVCFANATHTPTSQRVTSDEQMHNNDSIFSMVK